MRRTVAEILREYEALQARAEKEREERIRKLTEQYPVYGK